MRFELREEHLDGVEVGRIRRQVEEAGVFVLNRLPDAVDLMGGQIIHDDDVAGAERWGQAFFDIDFEDVAVHRTIDDQRRNDPVVAQAGDKGCRFPMSMRDRGEEPFAFAGAAIKPGHLGRRPGFVNEDKAFWIKPVLPGAPLGPRFGDVRPILFGGVRGFF